MSNAAVLAGLKSLAAGFANPIYWPGEKITPPEPPSAYVWAEVNGLGADLLGIGMQSLSARHGFVRFHILDAYGDSTEGQVAISDTLAALYGMLVNAAGVQGLNTFEPTPPETGAQSDDGLWFGVSISVPFVYWAGATA